MPLSLPPQPPAVLSAYDGAGRLPQPVVPQGFGVNIHFTSAPNAELQRFGEGGFGVARMDMAWASVEKQRGVYDFNPWDTLTQQLASIHVRPLYILDYNNPLYENNLPVHSNEGVAAFARFSASAASHYKGKHVIWEIWNEPNGDWFWKPKPDPDVYAKMAIASAKAMRAADPECTIIAPATSGVPLDYLESTFKNGLLDHVDAVSVHPYRDGPPESVVGDYRGLRELIGKYSRDRTVSIVCSEWGYPTSTLHGISEEQQAAYLAREWLVNIACGVDLSIWYDWKDDGDNPSDRESRFGTVHRDLGPKPSFDEAKRLIGLLRGYRFIRRTNRNDPTHWRLLFQSGKRLAVVEWDTAQDTPTVAAMPVVRMISASSARGPVAER